jgi:hypothetical protein
LSHCHLLVLVLVEGAQLLLLQWWPWWLSAGWMALDSSVLDGHQQLLLHLRQLLKTAAVQRQRPLLAAAQCWPGAVALLQVAAAAC